MSLGLVASLMALTACDRDAPAPPGGVSEAPPSSQAAPRVGFGTIFYYAQNTGGEFLYSWRPGTGAPTKLGGVPVVDALGSLTISPDGSRAAWVHSGETGPTQLTVSNVDGSGARVLRENVDPYCVEPAWLDNTRVVTRGGPDASGAMGPVGVVNVDTGDFTPLLNQFQGCHLVLAADGSTMAYASDGGITVANQDGTHPGKVPQLGEDGGPTRRRSFDPLSLSADGSLLALWVNTGDRPDGDVGRNLSANEIIGTIYGGTRELPVTTALIQAYFAPNGGVLLRVRGKVVNRVVLLSADLKLLAEADEPASIKSWLMMGYAPV